MKQTKRKQVAPAAAIPAVIVEESVMGTSGDSVSTVGGKASSEGAQAHRYALSSNCTVRDSVALKSALLDLLMDQHPVTIDVRAVERIDTAALQVLCAFVRDRNAAGGTVLWLGGSDTFREAVRLLGLQHVLNIAK